MYRLGSSARNSVRPACVIAGCMVAVAIQGRPRALLAAVGLHVLYTVSLARQRYRELRALYRVAELAARLWSSVVAHIGMRLPTIAGRTPSSSKIKPRTTAPGLGRHPATQHTRHGPDMHAQQRTNGRTANRCSGGGRVPPHQRNDRRDATPCQQFPPHTIHDTCRVHRRTGHIASSGRDMNPTSPHEIAHHRCAHCSPAESFTQPQCKHWQVPFVGPEKKEKPDKATERQAQMRAALQRAEQEYYKKMREPMEDVQAWFFRKE